ncbi:acyl-CoA dehydrogenase family protein [Streptomyces sp. NPDC049916]|uniref:acyl-CoA dehydrogenase family protein n=1 Tax=Streptomyces sp. NPDC049916 TaxID=3155156 RepID=UPI00341F3772
MDAAFTAEQDEIRRTLRDLLTRHAGPEAGRAAVGRAEGYDPDLWGRLARDLGLPGLALPAEYGGAGCTATELALACEETGRALLASPLFATAALAAVGRVAAEVVGTAASALERTVEYVRGREQFGRPIGSFQAVKHRLADLYVRVEAARSAAWDPDSGPLALAQALEADRITTAEAVQLHGGIGFTWEHEAHRFFKRAAGDELLFGPVHRLRDHAARGAGLFAADRAAAGVGVR